ncbi:1a [Symbiodinium natans]|uniref:1a protein n=1 Tax=Symbiodinium natans TaxID=878477 RepID=A0A812Q2B1_9DINO|nr:1a [Symbiodinium natans]
MMRVLLAFLSTTLQFVGATRHQAGHIQAEAVSYVDGVVPFPGDMISGVADWKCARGGGIYDEESGQCFVPGAALTRVVSCDYQSACRGGKYFDDKGFCYFPDKYTKITPARYQSDCIGGIHTGCGGGKCLKK